MSDLPYKLAQIAKSLQDMGKKAWSDAVATAGDEIERLKSATTPSPATAAMVEIAKEIVAAGEYNAEAIETARAFIAENEPES